MVLEQGLLMLKGAHLVLPLLELLGQFSLLLFQLLFAIDPLDDLLKLLIDERVQVFELRF